MQATYMGSASHVIFSLYMFSNEIANHTIHSHSSDERTVLNELPNLKTALRTRFRVTSMLEEPTFIICDVNCKADNENNAADDTSDDITAESLHSRHFRCEGEMQVIGKFRVMLRSKPKSMVEAYRTGVYYANYKDTTIFF